MAARRLSDLALLAFALALVFWIIPMETESVGYGRMEPADVPIVLAGLLAVLAGIQTVLPSQETSPDGRVLLRAASILTLAAAALAAMEIVGFLPAAVGFSALMMLFLRERRPLWLCLGIVVMPAAIWLAAEYGLGRPLP